MIKYLVAVALLVFACGSMAAGGHKHHDKSGPPSDCKSPLFPPTGHSHKHKGKPIPQPPTTDCGSEGGGGPNSGSPPGGGNDPHGGDDPGDGPPSGGPGNGPGGGPGNGPGGGPGDDPAGGGGKGPPSGGGSDGSTGGGDNDLPGILSGGPDDWKGGGNDGPNTFLTASVPEPGTLALLGAALFGFAFRRRKS